jgi:hypothetical protein
MSSGNIVRRAASCLSRRAFSPHERCEETVGIYQASLAGASGDPDSDASDILIEQSGVRALDPTPDLTAPKG